jgi:TolA-binding protein
MKFCFHLRLRKKSQLKKSKRSPHIRASLFNRYDDNRPQEMEQQLTNAQDKVDRLMSIITDTYENTLVRNLRLEELDMRSTDLFRDAEKMKNMAHKMQDKFFWEDSKWKINNILKNSRWKETRVLLEFKNRYIELSVYSR